MRQAEGVLARTGEGVREFAARDAPRTGSTHARAIGAAAVAAFVATAYVVFAAWQWSRFTVSSWDLTIFAQLLQRYSTFEVPIVPVRGDGFNLLGDHFHPLLAMIAPVYALFPFAFTLLVVQAVCFAVAAGAIAWTASKHLGPKSGVPLGAAFGLSWGLQYAAEVQFHEIALAVPLLALSLCAVVDRKWLAAASWAAPLVFVKEDLGLTVAAIGMLIALRARRPLGLWLAAWGLAWFAIAAFVVLPALNPGGSWSYASSANPSGTLADLPALFAASKGHTLALLAIVGAGLAFRSPIALVMVPTLAWRFLSTNHGYWGPTWHYSAVLMPIMFVALLDAIMSGRRSRRGWLRAYSRHAVAVSVVLSAALLPGLPLWNAVGAAAWEPPQRAEAANAVLAAVPEGASVETDIGLMSHLVDRHTVMWTGNANPVPDCILIDTISGGTPDDWGDVIDVARLLHPDERFQLVHADSGYELACRPAP